MKKLLLDYSIDDLARSFFILDLWLPNIASPIKIEYLYLVFEAIHKDLSKENKINTYQDFEAFCKNLFKLLPSFSMMEDYIPESDWGEIKYYFDNKFYKIFYGSTLENTYDYYYAFEILHRGLEKEYIKVVQRSPLRELEFCLSIQDYIIINLNQSIQQKPEVKPGDFNIPSEEFWLKANMFLTQFVPEQMFNAEMLKKYSYDVSSNENKPWPTLEEFYNRAFEGKNCLYYFINARNKYYPVMPRKYISVLYDTWGLILKQYYSENQNEQNNIKQAMEIQISKYISERYDEEKIIKLVSAVYPDKKAHSTVFLVAIHSKDNLFLIHVIPPLINKDDLTVYLDKLALDLKEADKLLSTYPTRLRAWLTENIIEFHHQKDICPLKPIFLNVIISGTLEMTSIKVSKDLPWKVIGLEQLVGIIDELEDSDELSDYFKYLEDLESSFIPPVISYLDKYGSFKDSHSVMIAGAFKPDFISLDPHWGTNYRFRSLSEYWKYFPEINFFGHPRSWTLPKKGQGKVLKSKIFNGYAYYQAIGLAVFFINSPINLMNYEQGKITDLMMGSIADALDLYKNILKELTITKQQFCIQILFVPASLVQFRADLNHLKHLIPNKNIWSMDISHIKNSDLVIRVVFDDKKIIDTLFNTKDRSTQIDLLISVLHQINSIWIDSNLQNIDKNLIEEKIKKSRFKIFSVEKEVSIPENIRTVLPEEKEFKLADKTIAELALKLGVAPGKYNQDKAKEKINQLINKLVNEINISVSKYNFNQAITLLIEKTDAMIFEYEMNKYQIKESLDQEVEFEREEILSEDYQNFLNNHRDYKYLIEKFVQLSPNENKEFSIDELKNLLALVNRLLNMYMISDTLYYEIYPAELEIHHDYLSSVIFSVGIPKMRKEYGEEQAKIELGIIGNIDDVPDNRTPIKSYLNTLDKAFRKDLGFGLRNFINVQQVMSLWAVYKKIPESAHYVATENDIAQVCLENIRGYKKDETNNILKFITLKPTDMLKIEGNPNPAYDLPVWEYHKRIARYNIKPLLEIGDKYIWGPYSVHRSARTWTTISSTHRLSLDIKAPTIISILNKGHEDSTNSLVDKGVEIIKRFTHLVQANVYLSKLDKSIPNIGDCDILGYLQDKNILLNIEAKIIDSAYCLKDIQRIQRKIFGIKEQNGYFKGGYLQKVERRDTYLKSKSFDIIQKIGWKKNDELPKVISIFLTKTSFWWTKFPPLETTIKFIEIRLLDYYIRNLV